MEHLFKLKKDGKCVGYLKIENCKLFATSVIFNKDVWGYVDKQIAADTGIGRLSFWLDEDVHEEICFDSIYPYVCDDKNGKKVFAGDKALADLTELTGEKDIQEIDAVVQGGFNFWDVEGHTFVEASEVGNIELIEESQCQ